MTTRISTLGILATALALGACSDSGGNNVACGGNTILINGVCVSTIVDVTCAAGTTLDPVTQRCEPDLSCATGTTYDPISGECQPNAVCGPNTTLNTDTGLCEPNIVCGPDTTFNTDTGECEPDVVCGGNTTLVDGECVADNRCGMGTAFNPATGTCAPTLVCGPGSSPFNDVCLTPAEIVAEGVDAEESIPDTNDPAFLSGVPETLLLEIAGEATIFTGVIGRAVDIDGVPPIDQDVDFWRFAATAGTRLRIRILADGLPGPTFLLTGPEGYARSSSLAIDDVNEREVVLPYDGDYDLSIAPALHRLGSAPLGDDDFGYVGIIEQLDWPTPVDVTIPAPGGDASTASASFLSGGGFFRLVGPAGSLAAVEVTSVGVDVWPVVLVFHADGSFIGQQSFTAASAPPGSVCDGGTYVICDGGNTYCVNEAPLYRTGTCNVPSSAGTPDSTFRFLNGYYASAADDLILVVDWAWGSGTDQDYDVSVLGAPVVGAGAIAVDTFVTTGELSIASRGVAGYEFSTGVGVVVTSDFTTSARRTLLGPSGIMADGAITPYHFYAEDAGDYVWVLVNTTANPTDTRLAITTSVPTIVPLDTFDGTTAVGATFSGSDLGYSRYLGDSVWFLADTPAAALLRARYKRSSGIADLEIWRVRADGAFEDRRVTLDTEYNFIGSLYDAPARSILRIYNPLGGRTPDPWVLDWDLSIDAEPVATILETTSDNSDMATGSQDLGTVSGTPTLRVLGENQNTVDELDHYTFTIDPPLATNELMWVRLENVGGASAQRFLIYNSAQTQIYPLPTDTAFTSTGYGIEFPLRSTDGVGPFFVRNEATSTGGPEAYYFELERQTASSETEPNNTSGTAHDLGELTFPFEIEGYCGGPTAPNADLDWFRFTLPTLGATEGLRIRIDTNMSSELKPALYDSNGTTKLLEDDQTDRLWFYKPAHTGPYFLEMKTDATSAATSRLRRLYRAQIELADNVEVEPNNDGATATPMNSLDADSTVSIWGHDVRLAADTFRVDLTTPINAGEMLVVDWQHLTLPGNSRVRLIGSDATTLLVLNRMYASQIVYTPPAAAAGPYYVEMAHDPASTSATTSQAYRIDVSRVSGFAGEVEPNNDQANAQTVALGAILRGQSTSMTGSTGPDPDVFHLTLPADLGTGEVIRIRGTVPLDTIDLQVTVLDGSFASVATLADPDPVLDFVPATTTSGTDFYVQLQSTNTTNDELIGYEVTVEVVTP